MINVSVYPLGYLFATAEPTRRHAAARRLARLADGEPTALLPAAARDADCEAGLALSEIASAATESVAIGPRRAGGSEPGTGWVCTL
jgi:hypothetical protein